MSLTEEADRERMWGFIPGLRQVLEHKEIPPRYYGCTSTDDNMFDAIDRLMRITVFLVNHKDDIRERMQSLDLEGREAMFRDLRTLERHLEDASHFFMDGVREIRTLCSELTNM